MDSPGGRLFDIRLACGDGRRDPEPLKEFSDRIKRETGVYFDPAKLSLLERMQQGWKWEDIDTLARVDPLKRGRAWLSAFAERDANPDVALPWAEAKRGAEPEPPPAAQARPKKPSRGTRGGSARPSRGKPGSADPGPPKGRR